MNQLEMISIRVNSHNNQKNFINRRQTNISKTSFVINSNIYNNKSRKKMIFDGSKFIQQIDKKHNNKKSSLIIAPVGIISMKNN